MRHIIRLRFLRSQVKPAAPKKAQPNKAKSKTKAFAQKSAYVNKTPAGEKKNVLGEPMAAAYDPTAVESAWQDWWDKEQFYTPSAERAMKTPPEKKFIMMIPPPNVTGSLHLGHALTTAIEDTLTRWNRMRGYDTLWLPGLDHAGIATQSVVEKKLLRDQNLRRVDMTRSDFLAKVWDWKAEYGAHIYEQFKRIGVSFDKSRFAFTLDPHMVTAVKEAFVRMWEKGTIYRSTRLVNWSSALCTAISDLEVDNIEFTGSTWVKVPGHTATVEVGVIHSFAYPIDGSDKEIVIATTRLETMLGDTAVAVHPDDPRYTELVGKMIKHPFLDRLIPIIADGELVQMEFGTGAVKVTPAHDKNDFDCGRRNGLPEINILTDEGKINAHGGSYEGMMRFDCRNKIEADLKERGLYRGKEDNPMKIGFCSKSKDIIEPYLKPQWYVSCADMANRAAQAVRDKKLNIVPEVHEKKWFEWLDEIRDWCISRQLWWGHQIPAYLVTVKDSSGNLVFVPDTNNHDHWIAGRSEEEALEKAKAKFATDPSYTIEVTQDEDVLDTWFSSGLFPFSTVGWPNTDSEDFKAFYPGTLLETGHDILFFWVARMVMMGLELTDELPFNNVYLHAMIRDAQGRKMSKSLGNVIDPLEVINGVGLDSLISKLKEGNLPPEEVKRATQDMQKQFPDGILECGADALRFGLLAYSMQEIEIKLDIKRVVGYRQFCNKIWNSVKYTIMCIGEDFTPMADFPSTHMANLSFENKWILSKLSYTVDKVNKHLEAYEFGSLANTIHNFWIHELCDVYLEAIKPVFAQKIADQLPLAQNTLHLVVETGIKMMHPLMPFITEEIYQRLPPLAGKAQTISLLTYPTAIQNTYDADIENRMDAVEDITHAFRSMMVNYGLGKQKPLGYVKYNIDGVQSLISNLANIGQVEITDAQPPRSLRDITKEQGIEVFLIVDSLDKEGYLKKMEKKKSEVEKYLLGIQKKMEKPGYVKSPENVRKQNAENMEEKQKHLEIILDSIEQVKKL